MKNFLLRSSALGLGLCGSLLAQSAQWWLTTPDRTNLLTRQTATLHFSPVAPDFRPDITVDPEQRYQSVDGFGFALTGGSAEHIARLPTPERRQLLTELFSTQGAGIGLSYLRVSIGSSDLNRRVFSYDDLTPDQTDVALAHFNLSDDRTYVVPLLQQIFGVQPGIKILGSPWSAPPWMKTNRNVQGGTLAREFYPVYAEYFVRYVKAMAAEGIPIDAITVQNEPFNDGNTPSMQLFPKEEADFIKDFLGPLFAREGIRTKIILYDHNCDAPEYPVSILTDPAARRYADGSGFHLYAGSVSAMTEVHDRFPDKNIYFTEMMAVDRHGFNAAQPVARILIGAMRNWSRNVILWNLAANAKFEPHTDNGGCTMCQGAITIDGDRVERNLAYYVIGHAAKFVPPGSVRVASTMESGLPNVAFVTPDGEKVLIIANTSGSARRCGIVCGGRGFSVELLSEAVATLVW